MRACQVLRPRRVAQALALSLLDILPSATQTASAPGISFLSRLNGWPARSPADASPTSSRMPAHGSGPMWLSGRGASYPTPPPQIPACSFPAPGSRRRSNAIVGLDAIDPQAHCLSDMLNPALSPEHALLPPSLRPAAFPPPSPPPISVGFVRCFNGTMQPSDSSSVPRQLSLLDFLSRPGITQATAGQTRSPRFPRDPSVRDMASDPGRATVPRITAPHMLPSAIATASAPAISRISWLNPTPHTITVYASPWSSPSTTQHSLPGGCYPFPGPDFHRLDRASFAWRTAIPSS
jgi:hypothetical protein